MTAEEYFAIALPTDEDFKKWTKSFFARVDRAIKATEKCLDFYIPAVVLVEKIGEYVEDAKSAMMLDGKDIYDVLEDTKLRDKKEEDNG